MLNEEKIRIMTRAAIYEQGKGEEDIKITSYSRSDYIRYNMLKTLIGCDGWCYFDFRALHSLQYGLFYDKFYAPEFDNNAQTGDCYIYCFYGGLCKYQFFCVCPQIYTGKKAHQNLQRRT